MADSKEIECLSRLEVVTYLCDLGIRPAKGKSLNPLYKEQYIKYICTRMLIHKNQVPDQIPMDIQNIKNFYLQHGRKEHLMIKHHESFFNAYIKPKRRASNIEECLRSHYLVFTMYY